MLDKLNALESNGAAIASNTGLLEGAEAAGTYHVKCFRDGKLIWEDDVKNAVCTEGKNSMLTNFFKTASFTNTVYVGLIESTGYGYAGANGSGVAATNLASAFTAAGSGTPANGWNGAPASMIAARQSPTFGTASAGSLAFSGTLNFTAASAGTLKGCYVLVKDTAGVAPVSTSTSTAGALWSAGLFTGGDKTVATNDVLQVSYTTSL